MCGRLDRGVDRHGLARAGSGSGLTLTVSDTFGPSALATPANAVTITRLLLAVPLLLLIPDHPSSCRATALWIILCITDAIDGYLARRHGTTRSGAFLDPLADKVVVLAAMTALVAQGTFWWLPVAIIAVRELGLVLYRTSAGRHGVSIPARPSAKLKTLVQDLAVGAALLPPLESHPWTARTTLWLAVFLTVWTGVQYLQDGRRVPRAV